MKQYSFNLPKETIEKFQQTVPERHRARTIRKVLSQKELILNKAFNDNIGEIDTVIHPFWLYDSTIESIDDIVKNLQKNHTKANRSLVMRIVLDEIIKTFKPIDPKDYVFRTFIVKKGTKGLLEDHVQGNERNEIVEDFILDEYYPNKNLDEIKKSPSNTEQITFTLHQDAYDRLDKLKDDLNEKGISRTKLMRDVLAQLIESYEKNQKDTIKEKFEQTFYEYKSAANPNEVKETLETYLSEIKESK